MLHIVIYCVGFLCMDVNLIGTRSLSMCMVCVLCVIVVI